MINRCYQDSGIALKTAPGFLNTVLCFLHVRLPLFSPVKLLISPGFCFAVIVLLNCLRPMTNSSGACLVL